MLSAASRPTLAKHARETVDKGGPPALEEVESGLIHAERSVYTEYPDPRRDERQTKILPALREISLRNLMETGLSRRMLIKARSGRVRPHRKNQELLAAIVRKLGMTRR